MFSATMAFAAGAAAEEAEVGAAADEAAVGAADEAEVEAAADVVADDSADVPADADAGADEACGAEEAAGAAAAADEAAAVGVVVAVELAAAVLELPQAARVSAPAPSPAATRTWRRLTRVCGPPTAAASSDSSGRPSDCSETP